MRIVRFGLFCACALLAACHGGGGGSPPPAATTYTIGGTVSGLSGTGLVLRNNAGNDLTVAASGTFAFSTALAAGAAYNVAVATQPTGPSQTCTVAAGSGTVGSANVSSVQLACTTNAFTVGAGVTGLDANGLVLQNNGGADLPVASNGTVTFPGMTLSGAAYAITVKTQPTVAPFPLPAQLCNVTGGAGTVGSTAVSVAIACAAPAFKFLYVANDGDDNLSAYSVNAATGTLTAIPGAPFAADTHPRYASPEITGRFLYVTNVGDTVDPPRVSAYTVDAASGVLTELAASPFELSVTPQPPGVPNFFFVSPPFIHRSGAFGYLQASTAPAAASKLFGATINSLTGELTEINGFPKDTGFATGGSQFDSSGRIFFLAANPTSPATNGEVRSFVVDPSGTLTPVGTFPTSGANPTFPLITPGESFLLVLAPFAGNLEVFALSKSGGAPNGVLAGVGTPVATGAAGSRPNFIAFNRRNNVLYVTNSNLGTAPPSLATFRMDPATGLLTAVGTPIATNGATVGPAVLHPSGRFLIQYNASTSSFQRFAIDPTTGAPTLQPGVTTPTDTPSGFALDFSGKYLYSLSQAARTISSYRMDATTGALTLVNSLPTGVQPFGVSPFGFQPSP
jgi:6-phosphogluconolactonase (cycloisomerase 2 family)